MKPKPALYIVTCKLRIPSTSHHAALRQALNDICAPATQVTFTVRREHDKAITLHLDETQEKRLEKWRKAKAS